MRKTRLPVRANYRGEQIPAAAGVLFVFPALALCVLLPAVLPGLALDFHFLGGAVTIFAGLGLLDDLWGTREFGGIGGHVRALVRHGRVTTGLVKLVGGGAAALALGWLAARQWPVALLNGALIALAANLVNLLDLRPGRALKAFGLGALLLAPLAGRAGMAPLAAVLVPVGAYAPWDLRARVMMGDTGANALGAALGATAALHLGLVEKCAALGALAALQVASEFVSFSAVIERCRPLRWLDQWGRGG